MISTGFQRSVPLKSSYILSDLIRIIRAKAYHNSNFKAVLMGRNVWMRKAQGVLLRQAWFRNNLFGSSNMTILKYQFSLVFKHDWRC